MYLVFSQYLLLMPTPRQFNTELLMQPGADIRLTSDGSVWRFTLDSDCLCAKHFESARRRI
jgi:hypothetical protein